MNEDKIEICGDGINLGQLECDDGNLANGDGCNSDCEVEAGFECYRQVDGPDICRDINPPRATLEVLKGNNLRINFNEIVYSSLPSIVVVQRYR